MDVDKEIKTQARQKKNCVLALIVLALLVMLILVAMVATMSSDKIGVP